MKTAYCISSLVILAAMLDGSNVYASNYSNVITGSQFGTASSAQLLAFWQLNGDATDATGAHNGTITSPGGGGGTASWVSGVNLVGMGGGQALQFNNTPTNFTTANPAYLSASASGFPTGNNDRSFVGWVNASSNYNTYPLLLQYGSAGTLTQAFQVELNSSGAASGSQWGGAVNGTTNVFNKWFFVAATVTHTTGGNATWSLYVVDPASGTLASPPSINGTGTGNSGSGSLATNTVIGASGGTSQVFLGAQTASGGSYNNSIVMNGAVEGVALFGTALTPAQIQTLYNAAFAVPEPGTLLLGSFGLGALVWFALVRRQNSLADARRTSA